MGTRALSGLALACLSSATLPTASAEPQVSPPAVMHIKSSGGHCATWRTDTPSLHVVSFSRDSVVMDRTDPPSPYFPRGLRFRYVGQLSPDGNHIVGGTQTVTFGMGPGSGPFYAAWGPAIDDVPGQDGPACASWVPGKPPAAAPEPPGEALPSASCGEPVRRFPLDPWDPRFTPPPGAAFAAEIARADELFRGKKYGDAGRIYLRAGYAKDAYASRRLGLIFLFGLAENDPSFATDPAVASAFFQQAADKGDAASARMLGWMAAKGIGVKQDFGQARQLFEPAARRGYPEAEISIGLLYARGDGVEPSYSDAMRWFKLAIGHGDPNGWVAVGSLYEDGLGVERSETEAMRLYRRAADEGSALGAQNVARLHEQGIGVPKDLSTALCWYGKAAAAGDADSMNRLGLWFDQQHRYAEALRWFLAGANAGNSDAMYNVGRYCTNGIAGPRTTDAESGGWFWRAQNLGNAQAARVLEARRQAVAQMLTVGYAIITAPPPPPRCYKVYGPNYNQRSQVPCSGDWDYRQTGW